ncbi:nitroreductase family protein [Microbacterium jejuense]|uniref:nitroreductase family protein n=1 Tax=Microbacterium jejuense TaxID=1263637 RepID=UPI0031EE31E9
MSLTDTGIHSDTLVSDRYGARQPIGFRVDPAGVVPLLLAHRSVRAFDPTPIADEVIDTLIASAQSASTSSNLQSWSVIVVRDPARKAEAAALAGEQQFIADAPVFLVFVADWARGVDIARRRGEASVGIEYLDSTLVATIDAALAAQNAVVAAESLGLGAVYVGAVRNNPEQLSELLGLPDATYPVVGVAIGRPAESGRARVKPRLPQSVVRHDERYRAAAAEDLEGYDRVLRSFNESHGRSGGWLESVIARVRSRSALHGRDALRSVLDKRGLPSA